MGKYYGIQENIGTSVTAETLIKCTTRIWDEFSERGNNNNRNL